MDSIIDSCNLRVFVRIRPVPGDDEAGIGQSAVASYSPISKTGQVEAVCSFHVDHHTVDVDGKRFHSHGIFNVEHCVELMANSLHSSSGGDFTFLSYGQTASGKTTTVVETLSSFSERIVEFSKQHTSTTLKFSAFELRGNSSVDLLSEVGMAGVRCLIREDAEGKVQIANCTAITVETHEHLLEIIKAAFSRRKSSATSANEASSRTHAFCSFILTNGDITRRIRLIDLAGSERWEDSIHHTAERIAEMKSINFSLGCLKECVRLTLRAAKSKPGQSVHVPYRRSKLTMLLKDIFVDEGNTTVIVAHLSPLRSQLKHSLNTMQNFVKTLLERDTLAMREKKTFTGPIAWSADDMSAFVANVEGGQFTALAPSFRLTGKLFSAEWIGHVHRRTIAAGGTEADGDRIYEAFHDEVAKHKATSEQPDVSSGRSSASSSSARGGGLSLKERRAMKAKFAATFSADDVVVVSKKEEKGNEKAK